VINWIITSLRRRGALVCARRLAPQYRHDARNGQMLIALDSAVPLKLCGYELLRGSPWLVSPDGSLYLGSLVSQVSTS
jgi:hypothetical protein